MSRLITNTWFHLNRNEKEEISGDIILYTDLENMMASNIPKEDILNYREQFSNLPWEQCGYKKPKLEVLT